MLDASETLDAEAKRLTKESMVLFADDDQDMLEICAGQFRNWGYKVATVAGSEELLGWLGEMTTPAVVILDLNFGPREMYGLELIPHIKQAAQFPVSIIVYSGTSAEKSQVQAYEAGADHYLVKPTDSIILMRAIVDRESERLQERILEQVDGFIKSRSDRLTGLLNISQFDEEAVRHLQRAKMDDEPVSLLFADLDEFTKLNNVYGHVAANEVLQKVARCLAEHARPEDLVCRYGGDEFCLLVPGLGKDKAEELAMRIMRAVRNLKLPDVSVSCGTHTLQPEEIGKFSLALNVLKEGADKAMYACKQARIQSAEA